MRGPKYSFLHPFFRFGGYRKPVLGLGEGPRGEGKCPGRSSPSTSSRAWSAECEPLVRRFGLTGAGYFVLTSLADHAQTSSGELAQASGVRYQTMNETLDRLEKAGLIERPGPVGPGFVRRAWLTRRGTVVVERCRAALTEVEHHMLRRFSAEQVDLLQQFLEECSLQLRRLPRPRPLPCRLEEAHQRRPGDDEQHTEDTGPIHRVVDDA